MKQTTEQKIKGLNYLNLVNKVKDILMDLLTRPTGISEAPRDGKLYGRKDGTWQELGS